MDLIDEKALTDKVINPFLDRLKGEVIPALEVALRNSLRELDGWTITIVLNKPKEAL